MPRRRASAIFLQRKTAALPLRAAVSCFAVDCSFRIARQREPDAKSEVERRVSLLNKVVNAFAILLDMASRLEQIGQFHFFGVAQSHFEPVDVDADLLVEVTAINRRGDALRRLPAEVPP